MDGNLYGVPFTTTNTWFMYYDKSVFSEEDIKNLDTMLEKGVVSFPFTNSWYSACLLYLETAVPCSETAQMRPQGWILAEKRQ